MTDTKTSATYTARQQMLRDVLTTACEGGTSC